MKDSNSHNHFSTCEVCGEQVDLRVLCEVWKHQHNGSDLQIDPSIVGVRVSTSKMTPHVNFKGFRHLMSAMLFVSDSRDREEEINDLYIQYRESSCADPVVWALDYFEKYGPDTHDMYVRETFSAKNYSDLNHV
jgi:hypothetical protein